MNIRITPQATLDRQLGYLRQQSTALSGLQEQLATGLRLNHPSDDPTGWVPYLQTQDLISQAVSQQSNLSSVQDRLEQGNTTLTQVSQLLNKARQIALEGANTSNNSTSYAALASEVDSLVNQVLTLANQQADGRYLFGGTNTTQAPFAVTATNPVGQPATVSYQGSPNRASAPVGPGAPVDMLYTGQEIFQQPGKDVFVQLINLRDQLRNVGGLSDTAQAQALSQTADDIQGAQQGVLGIVSTMSASLQALSSLNTQLSNQKTQMQVRAGDLGSADLAGVVVQAQAQQALFQATLSLSARVFNQNLLDYLPVQ